MATWADDIVKALITLGGEAHLSEIYKAVKKVRHGPYPEKFEETIQGSIENKSSDSKKFRKGGKDLFFTVNGLGNGRWGLRDFVEKTPIAMDFEERTGKQNPERKRQETYRILRDTQLARKIKLLCQNQCQFCGEFIELSNGQRYSEAHHIKPLGMPHNGPDIEGNIMVLCPNHHVMMDYGTVSLNILELQNTSPHQIGEEFIEYHNQKIVVLNPIKKRRSD